MADDLALDPGSRIPDPPLVEEDVLEWARELTEKLRNDHSDNVDRVENLVMSDNRTTKRPAATGSKRFFHDEYSGIVYLDSIEGGEPKWIPINYKTTYSPDGRGVHVYYSTSLPDSGLGVSAYFEYDEEAWDEASYWSSGSVITIPETRYYQVQFLAGISALAAGNEIIISAWAEGVPLDTNTERHVIWQSDGAAKELKLNFNIDLIEDDELQIGYVTSAGTFTLDKCHLTVTPLTEDVGSGSPGNTEHSALSGLSGDDHLQYLLASDATNRTTFASYWTDLTDAGETALHTHAATYTGDICLPVGSAYQIKDGDDTCRDMIEFNGTTIEIGNAIYAATIRSGAMALIATTLTQNTGAWDVNSTGGITIDTTNATGISINSAVGLLLQADVDIILKNDGASYDVIIATHGSVLQGTLASTDNIDMIGVTSAAPADRIAISDASVGVWLNTGAVYVGPASGSASAIYFYTAASTAKKMLEFSTVFNVGLTGEATNIAGTDIYLDSDNDLIVTAAIASFTGIVDVDGRLRLPYLGDIPSSPVNGDMWVEDDGIHVYRGGAEYIVTDYSA